MSAPAELVAIPTTIHGSVVGHDGEPLELAQVELMLPGQAPVEVPVAADGSFTLTIPEPGWASLHMTGISHAEHVLGFMPSVGDHKLEVQLGTYKRPEAPEEIALTGRFDGEGRSVARLFTAREDGTWVATIERGEANAAAKEFYYQLSEVTSEGRTINGTAADRYVYDGGGDYFSVLTLADAPSFEVVYDPAAMPPAGLAPKLGHGDPSSSLARTAKLHQTITSWQDGVIRAVQKAVSTTPGLEFDEVMLVEQSRLRVQIQAALEAEQDPTLHKLLLVAWAATLSRELARSEAEDEQAERANQAALAKQVLAELGPREPIWSMDAWAMSKALAFVDDSQYLTIAANEHPDPTVSLGVWLMLLVEADRVGDLEGARAAMAAISGPRFAELEDRMYANSYDPDRPSAPGQTVPDFRLMSADGKTEYSPESLRGTTYVLDFWATWCTPCVAEMPNLHAAYAAINGQKPRTDRKYRRVAKPKLEIISVSFDLEPEAVGKFRKQEWPMPWVHVSPEPERFQAISDSFGISGIPTMVLVGPDGVILASSPRLDGGKLLEIGQEKQL